MKSNVFSHIKAALILPFTVLVVVPALILYFTNNLEGTWSWDYPSSPPRIAGGVIIAAIGLCLFFATVRLFAVIGRGTLAPWEPPRELVVSGVYRYMRNPMISGVLLVLLSEATLFGSLAILIWSVLFFAGNSVYFRFCEEPTLVRRFGERYIKYRRNVPAWLPRIRPYKG